MWPESPPALRQSPRELLPPSSICRAAVGVGRGTPWHVHLWHRGNLEATTQDRHPQVRRRRSQGQQSAPPEGAACWARWRGQPRGCIPARRPLVSACQDSENKLSPRRFRPDTAEDLTPENHPCNSKSRSLHQHKGNAILPTRQPTPRATAQLGNRSSGYQAPSTSPPAPRPPQLCPAALLQVQDSRSKGPSLLPPGTGRQPRAAGAALTRRGGAQTWEKPRKSQRGPSGRPQWPHCPQVRVTR